MKYELINSINPNYSTIQQVLVNRGIDINDIEHYLNSSDNDINSPEAFGKSTMDLAARALIQAIAADYDCFIQVDSDCDGYTSGATLINYLYDLFPAWVRNHLIWRIHDGKQHGLIPETIPLSCKLIIAPDSSSNDYEEHKVLKDRGATIIVLDHHEAEKISQNAIIVNNQLSDYSNKELSGVGVVYQFCRYIDAMLNKSYADDYLDLVALGLDADMMSLRSIETKHLICKGLKQVKNPFFYAMAQKNAYSLGGELTPIGVAFYIAPFVNAMVRSGTQEEKELLFKSMLKFEAFEEIPSTKRGHKLGEMEQVVEQAIRTATNVKNRQTKAQESGLEFLEHMIEEQDLLQHKVLLFLLKPGQIDKNIAGLIANKFMAKYQRPCCILTRVEEVIKEDYWCEETESYQETLVDRVSYQGSARGYDKSGITNFKDICVDTGSIMYAEGHQGAFGLGILVDEIDNFLESTDEILSSMSAEPFYSVDYIYNNTEVNKSNILEIAELNYLWGKDMDEPLIAIKGLKVTESMVTLMSPDKKPTLKITLPNGVALIKFGSSQKEYEQISTSGYVELDIVGTCNKNEWNGYITPQIFIQDYEIVDAKSYFF